MRLTAIAAGVFTCAVIFSANTSLAAAETENTKLIPANIKIAQVVNKELSAAAKPKKNTKKPIEHMIIKGETLVKISKKYKLEWSRIYDKNLSIKNPDVINTGEKIIIPDAKEKLKERKIPQPHPKTQPQLRPENTKTKLDTSSDKKSNPVKYKKQYKSGSSYKNKQSTRVKRASSAGNTYSPGYCTYYAKQRRPDLPNNLGNAETWVSRARAQGIPTGSMPRVGAIGQKGNHVVYVQKINSNGTIVISEMNWSGLWNITTRTVSAGSHTYIY
ncbi:LysM peptidoglycan-binding domain-containing protein [Candidatus Parcubacteria bacterium]|nr:LysM peptidoglycan-binding domain-containing protein [Candidatus Parcubacteria bacterium]